MAAAKRRKEKSMAKIVENVKVDVQSEEFQKFLKKFRRESRLPVTRESFHSEKSEKDMWAYVVCGDISIKSHAGDIIKKDVKASFEAKDKGGYEVLDFIFMIDETAELIIKEDSMTDDYGKKTVYDVYEVSQVDGDGVPYSYQVKPMRASDKFHLNSIITKLAIQAYKEQLAAEAATTVSAPAGT